MDNYLVQCLRLWLLLVIVLFGVAYPSNTTLPYKEIQQLQGRENLIEIPYIWQPKANSLESLEYQSAAQVFFREAIMMATIADSLLTPEDPVYQRYFEPGDFNLVKGIFERISGAWSNRAGKGSLDFSKLWVYEGSSPYTSAPDPCNSIPYLAAAIDQSTTRTKIPGLYLPKNNAAISLCPTLLTLPALIDAKCPCAGDRDSYAMLTGGGAMLHEFIHWRYLVQGAPSFDDLIGSEPEIIGDYSKAKSKPYNADGDKFAVPPVNGYGPLSASQLVGHERGDARNNADNYMWYAVSKMWQMMCPNPAGGPGPPFLPSVDNHAGLRNRAAPAMDDGDDGTGT